MNSPHRGLSCALVVVMLSCVLSRSFCQAVTGVNRPIFRSLLRTSTTCSTKQGETSDNVSVVTYLQLKTMLSHNNIQLFDVRNPDEYQAGHISEAVNIPLDNLEESLKLSSERFRQIYEVQAPGKGDNNIVFHCRSGVRSLKALGIAHQLGFTRARHYEGGYSEWAELEGK